MSTKEKQAEAYLKEAKLSVEAAKANLEKAQETQKSLWHNIVKSSYDAMEQAISAVLAHNEMSIPRSHPGKVEKFVKKFGESKITERIYKWLRKRSKTQYVDLKKDEIIVPHMFFDESDAESALDDAEFVVQKVDNDLSEAK